MQKEIADRILIDASKGAVLEHIATTMRPKEGPLFTAVNAKRLRTQVQSLGLDMKKDTGFNDKVISYLYTLEVQACIEAGEESELQELQEAYDIPQEIAAEIVQVTCKRYISQLLTIGLAAAKKYKEEESNSITLQIVKFMYFFDEAVDADGNLFNEEDKERLITFFRDRDGSNLSAEEKKEVASRLISLIHLNPDFIPPLEGLAGLKGEAKTDRSATGMMM